METTIILEEKCIATKLELNVGIEKPTEKIFVYVTLKDNKENFQANPPCQFINENINKRLKSNISYNQKPEPKQ